MRARSGKQYFWAAQDLLQLSAAFLGEWSVSRNVRILTAWAMYFISFPDQVWFIKINFNRFFQNSPLKRMNYWGTSGQFDCLKYLNHSFIYKIGRFRPGHE